MQEIREGAYFGILTWVLNTVLVALLSGTSQHISHYQGTPDFYAMNITIDNEGRVDAIT